ncbi:MAG: cytochrome c biogenesis protein, partial [Planctomycetes bacterium]|nr:cytochrome c biogenesis protein [Planctomycetota bacterium]
MAEIRGEPGKVRPELADFDKQTDQARALDTSDMTFFQRKLLEADNRFRTYTLMASAFQPIDFPPLPTAEEFEKNREGSTEIILRIRQMMAAATETDRMLERMQPPLAVPQLPDGGGKTEAGEPEKPWLPYASAVNKAYLRQVLNEPANPAVEQLKAIFAAYGRGDAVSFNREVAQYRRLLDERTPEQLDPTKVAFESYFNYVSPFYLCIVLYIFAFILAISAWLGWSRTLNRSAMAVLIIAFVIHTLGLVARVYISGRPPVTNLYSSAVFIGWACVLFGLVLEAIFRLGIGNVVAAVGGCGTLFIAAFLGLRGDTFTVLQAVLDTQFWLATHVVCVTLGYAVTFLAGLLGIIYVFLGVFTRSLSSEIG